MKVIKNKKIIITIYILMLILMKNLNVNALCTSKIYSDLKKTAYKTEVSYELKFDESKNHYFEVKIANMDKDVILKFNGVIYESTGDVFTVNTKLDGGKTYEFNLYGGYDSACVEEFLYTKKIKIPKYNVYSERDECIEYEEFEMCNKWYQGDIRDEEYFKEKLNAYIESLKPKEEPKKEEPKEKNIIEKIIDFYMSNLIITLPITIVVVLGIIVKIIVNLIRKRNRVKLDD